MSECAKYRHMQRNLSGLRTTAVAAILLFMFERQVHCACTQMAVVSEQGGGGRGKMEECITNVCLQSPCIWIERINTNCVCQVTQFWSCRVNTDKRLKIRLKGSPDRPPPHIHQLLWEDADVSRPDEKCNLSGVFWFCR